MGRWLSSDWHSIFLHRRTSLNTDQLVQREASEKQPEFAFRRMTIINKLTTIRQKIREFEIQTIPTVSP